MPKTSKSKISRKGFLKITAASIWTTFLAACGVGGNEEEETPRREAPYQAQVDQVSVRILWTGDIHGQLKPVYYREYFGEEILKRYGFAQDSLEAYLSSSVNFLELTKQYGKVGGMGQLATVIEQERARYPENTLLLDSGDTWHGSAVTTFTQGKAFVDVMNMIGYDAFTFHWELDYGQETFLKRVDEAQFAVIAQNLVDTDFEDRVLEASIIKEYDGLRVGIVGEANPFSLDSGEGLNSTEGLRLGYRETALQEEINRLRNEEGVGLVVLLSHMGYPQDRVMAEFLTGVDVIIGGHTHDILWEPEFIGKTLLAHAGSMGKFLGELDLEVKNGEVVGYNYRLIPILSERIEARADIQGLVDALYQPYDAQLNRVIGENRSTLYRADFYGGTTDAYLGKAYREINSSEVSFTPGWRYGITLIPGEVTVEDIYNVFKPMETPLYKVRMNGAQIKVTLENSMESALAADPIKRTAGDLVRCTGVESDFYPNGAYPKRLIDPLVNGEALVSEQMYTVATSGGRSQNMDPAFESSEGSSNDELIKYIEQNSPIISDDPIRGFRPVEGSG